MIDPGALAAATVVVGTAALMRRGPVARLVFGASDGRPPSLLDRSPAPVLAIAVAFGAVVGRVTSVPVATAVVALGAGLSVVACRLASNGKRVRQRRALERAMPGLIDELARSFRSGAGVREAVVEMVDGAPSAIEASVNPLGEDLRCGRPVIDSVVAWLGPEPVLGGRMLAGVLAVAVPLGGAAGPALDRAADAVRARHAIEREVGALSSQARSSATVLAVVPLVFSALLSVVSPDVLSFFLGHPLGVPVLCIGLGLDALGLWSMRLLVERAI